MTSQANPLIDCRLCLEKHRHILPITAEISEVYKNVTQIKVSKNYIEDIQKYDLKSPDI